MVELEQTIKNVYFLGIGGIGMSALARYFKAKGYKVAGYDRTLSALTQKMQAEEEIRINYIDEEEEIPAEFRDKTTTLVVYTPAIPGDNRQRAYFVGAGFGGPGYDFPERKGDLCSRYTWENDGIYADCLFVKEFNRRM